MSGQRAPLAYVSPTTTSVTPRQWDTSDMIMVRVGQLTSSSLQRFGFYEPAAVELPRPTLQALLAHVDAELRDSEVGSEGVAPAAAKAARSFAERVLTDGAPTPQISALAEGGVAVEWLVDGTHLVAHFDADGGLHTWADAPSGDENFDFECGADVNPEALRAVRALLSTLSGRVNRAHRVAVRGA